MQWIAIDLTTQRSWLMEEERPVATRTGETPVDLIGDWTGPQVIAGLDTEEIKVPCKVLPKTGTFPSVVQDKPAHILPHAAAIAGFLSANDDWDGVIVWIADLVHWVHISAGEIVSFQSSVVPELADDDEYSLTAFDAGFDQSLDRPERLLTNLASARAKPLARDAHNGLVLGLLVGADLKAARPYWLGQRVAVIGNSPIGAAYARGLSAQGCPVTQHPDTTLAGLVAVFKGLRK